MCFRGLESCVSRTPRGTSAIAAQGFKDKYCRADDLFHDNNLLQKNLTQMVRELLHQDIPGHLASRIM